MSNDYKFGDRIMLAQFQNLYPTGSVISELLQIHEGKYLVRVSLQIEGVTRATGMAGAETLELAEDKARSRALMVLGIDSKPQAEKAFSLEPTPQVSSDHSFTTTPQFNDAPSSFEPLPEIESPPPVPKVSPGLKGKNQRLADTSTPEKFDVLEENFGMISDIEPESNANSGNSYGNVAQFVPRSYSFEENTAASAGKKASEPVDLSDVMAKIDVEMERLAWTKEQGRDYLIKTYNKRGRSLLSDEELQGFLRYLESQPTPIDPSMGF